ncbi:MAG: undecaprenyl-diphosphate phosphatase [Bacteroidales bacterium]|nr:undecaprenyl-diphosphate phosphatase [Bacteroidales bacterium]MCL2133075.1 undecaprenyl-diphosphate phosphatase [Bacteroidales bacterium]
MEWFEALVLGLVQGLTEFLPISSSGHLAVANALFGNTGAGNLTFTIAVHAGTVCSTLLVLWTEISRLFNGLFNFKWNDETQYIAKILLSVIPVAIVGVLFRHQVEALFDGGLYIVGAALLLTAGLLALTYFIKPRKKEKISFKDALLIGTAQAIAVIPGLSRSGATISTGLLLGNKKEMVAKFSFLMVLIPVLGECFLDLMKGGFSGSATLPVSSLLAGFFAAFVSGAIACKLMINLVKKGKLIYFAIYCAVVGVLVLLFL